MARSKKRRENHRTSIVVDDDGGRRAEIILAVDDLEVDSKPVSNLASLQRWFPKVTGFRAGALNPSGDSVSVVLDDFMFVLYVGGLGAEFAGIHDGAEFTAAATDGPVAVYVTDGVDVRRSRPADLDEAAANGRLLGASVAAFVVQSL